MIVEAAMFHLQGIYTLMEDICKHGGRKFGFSIDKRDALDAIAKGMLDKNQHILIAEESSKVVGLLWLQIVPYAFDKNNIHMHEILWHTHTELSHIKRGRIQIGLYEKMEKIAEDNNVNHIYAGAPDGNDICWFLERRGYKLRERNYVKVVA